MLVVVGLFLPLLVAAQETTADSASVESLPLRADVSTNELSDAVLKLVNPANTPGITVEIQRYQQEVTLKSTLRNVDDAIEDSRWQSNVIDAARSVDLGDGTADDVVWDWARSTPITRLDPNTSRPPPEHPLNTFLRFSAVRMCYQHIFEGFVPSNFSPICSIFHSIGSITL